VFDIIILIIIIILLLLSFFPWHMNLSTADLRNYWTEFHETWWSYMFLVDPKVFRFVVKGVKAIFLGVQRG
jgi:amino acid transporter